MRFVGLMPHTMDTYYAPEAAEGLVGKPVPFRAPGQPEGVCQVTAARVDKRGVHIEVEVPAEHWPEGLTASLAGGVSIEPDPLLRVGCVQSPHALDTHEGRDALREVVKAATARYLGGEAGARKVPPSGEV